MVNHFEETHSEIDDNFIVAIEHADCLADAEFVRDQLAEKFGVKNFMIELLDPVIGAHTGPGLVVVCYPCKPRS